MNLDVSAWPTRRGLWNVDDGYLRTIPYCFVDRRTYEKVGDAGGLCRINAALNIWAEALNGGADAISGHALGFRTPTHPEDFCCTSYRYGAEGQPRTATDFQCDWDHAKWPSDTLAVHWVDEAKAAGTVASASTGYWKAADVDQYPGRHFMRVGDDASPADIAHEFGHGASPHPPPTISHAAPLTPVVLGMAHEHQRWDRDDHVEFRCANLVGMTDVYIPRVRAAERMDYATAYAALCADMHTAEKYFAPSAEYVKGAGLDAATRPALDGPGGFDMESIMLYDSYSFAKAGQVTVDTAVLVAIRKDAGGKKIAGSERMIPRIQRPSAKDVAFVKRFFPWDEARFREWKKKHPRGR
jgi:hypothetical protein